MVVMVWYIKGLRRTYYYYCRGRFTRDALVFSGGVMAPRFSRRRFSSPVYGRGGGGNTSSGSVTLPNDILEYSSTVVVRHLPESY